MVLSTELVQLQRCLAELKAEDDSNVLVDTTRTAEDIVRIVLNEVQDVEAGSAISMLFNNTKGILKFLERGSGVKEYEDAKAILLQFLPKLFKRFKVEARPFLIEVKVVAERMFSRESAAKIQDAVLGFLIDTIPHVQTGAEMESFDIPGLYLKLIILFQTQESKLSAGVKASLLELLGIIIRHHALLIPKRDDASPERLFKICMRIVNDELFSKKAKKELPLAAGALRGIDQILFSVPEFANKELFKFLTTGINPPDNIKRYEVPKAALSLLENHAPLFSKQLLDNTKSIFDQVIKLSVHQNVELRRAASRGYDSFIQVVCAEMANDVDSGYVNIKTTFWLLMKHFMSTMKNVDANMKEVALAVRGYGFLAKPAKAILKESDITVMVQGLLQKTSFVFAEVNDQAEDTLMLLPAFLQAYGLILQEFDTLVSLDDVVVMLVRIFGIMLVNFRRIGQSPRYVLLKSLNSLLAILFKKGLGFFLSFFDRVVYDALVITCTDVAPPIHNKMSSCEGEEGDDRIRLEVSEHAYMDYLEMWQNVINRRAALQSGITEADLDTYITTLYDGLMRAIIRLTDNLNLSLKSIKDNADGSVDRLEPDRPKDFQILINMVDFVLLFIPQLSNELYSRWVHIFGLHVITLSTKNELVSGFYKLFAMNLKLCEAISFFSEKVDNNATTTEVTTREFTKNLFIKYLSEVIQRMQQYKDDLLASCLRLLLSSPKELIAISKLIVPLQTALRMGLSYTPLAFAAVDALEYWIQQNPEDVQKNMAKVLPSFCDYLFETADSDLAYDFSNEKKQLRAVVKANSAYSKKKQSAGAKVVPNGNEISFEMPSLRIRILRLLGRIGGHNKSVIANLGDFADDGRTGLAWDHNRRLRYIMDLCDIRITLIFDELLPRVVQLAEASVERKTKVAACELLQALVIFMLAATDSSITKDDTARPNLAGLLKHVFPAVLRLAVDVDQVTRQLFEPLSKQIIHWFTRGGEDQIMELLQQLLLDHVSNNDHVPLREFAAICFAELLEWTIKQSKKNLIDLVKPIFKKLYDLAGHRSPYKRLGAMICFNKIYRIWREERSLVDAFFFEILGSVLRSLQSAHGEEIKIGTIEQGKDQVNHLLKIATTRMGDLKDGSKERRPMVAPFRQGVSGEAELIGAGEEQVLQIFTLSQLLPFLFNEASRPETVYAHECMQLFKDVLQMLTAFSPGEWMRKNVRSSKSIFELYEPDLSDMMDADQVSETESFNLSKKMFEELCRSVDGYYWLVGMTMIKPILLFSPESHILKDVRAFLEDYCQSLTVLNDNAIPIGLNNKLIQLNSLGPSDRIRFQTLKSAALTKILLLFSQLLVVARPNDEFMAQLQSPDMSSFREVVFSTIGRCILCPTALGFDMNDSEVKQELPRLLGELLPLIQQKFNNACKDMFISEVAKLLQMPTLDFSLLRPDDVDLNLMHYSQLPQGYLLLHEANLLEPALQQAGTTLSKLSERLFDQAMLMNAHQAPLRGSVASNLFRLALVNAKAEQMMLLQITDQRLIVSGKSSAKKRKSLENASTAATSQSETAGVTFVSQFSQDICMYYATHFDVYVKHLELYPKDPIFVELMLSLIQFLISNRKYINERLKFLDTITKSDAIITLLRSRLSPSSLLAVWSGLLKIDGKFLQHASPAFKKGFYEGYRDLISRDKPLAEKLDALSLLPVILTYGSEFVQMILAEVHALIGLQFPARSSDYKKGTVQFTDYITALDRLLEALWMSKSPGLLVELTSVICREQEHVHESAIQAALTRFVKEHMRAKVTTEDNIRRLQDVVAKVYAVVQSTAYTAEQRCLVVQKLLLPLLFQVPESVLLSFYEQHVGSIFGRVQADLPNGTLETLQEHLLDRICAFELIQLLYTRVDTSQVNSAEGRVFNAYANSQLLGKERKGKEMTTAAVRAFQDSRKQVLVVGAVGSSELSAKLNKIRNDYFCSAYNACCAVVLRTQNQEKFFTTFLFKSSAWLPNIDQTPQYNFKVELEARFERRRVVDLRADMTAGSQKESRNSVQYMSSQYLADSSLSQSISITHQAVSAIDETTPQATNEGSTSGPNDSPLRDTGNSQEELELDDINRNPTMIMLLRVVDKLHNEVSKPAQSPTEMPSWMKELSDVFAAPTTHINAKLFLAKLITNRPHVFEPYSKFWWQDLAKLIMNSDQYGEPLNYFVQDLCQVINIWSTPSPATSTLPTKWPALKPQDDYHERAVASELISFIMKNAYAEKKSILRSNLEILKGFCETWHDMLTIDTETIFNQLTRVTSKEKKDNMVGIQLLGVVVANGLEPFNRTTSGSVTEDTFYTKLVENITFKHSETYSSAAEVCGMVCKLLSQTPGVNSSLELLLSKMQAVFHKIATSAESSDSDRFFNALNKVQRHYPQFSDDFMKYVFDKLARTRGNYRLFALEIMLSRATVMPLEIFANLLNNDLIGLLRYNDEAIQLTTTLILNQIVKDLSVQQITVFLQPAVTHLSTHNSLRCRLSYYDLLAWLFDHRCNSSDQSLDTTHSLLIKKELLKGLVDDSELIRSKLMEFWNNNSRLPEDTVTRIQSILSDLYDADVEHFYLNYASSLLLETTKKSASFKNRIFDYAHNDDRINNLPKTTLDQSWQQQSATMVPMFALTQPRSQDENDDMDIDQEGVRATQKVFSQTQFENTSLGTIGASLSILDYTQQTQDSTLLFTIGSTSSTSRVSSDNFGGNKGDESRYARIRKRFTKTNAEMQALVQIKRAERHRKQEEKANRARIEQRQKQVTVFRAYRFGELPDVEIKHEELVLPLQALVQKDSEIAQIIFSGLYLGVLQTEKNDTVDEEARNLIAINIAKILRQSKQFFPPFVTALLRVQLQSDDVARVVPVDVIGRASHGASSYHLGILALEKVIQVNQQKVQPEASSSSSRGRKSSHAPAKVPQSVVLANHDKEAWRQLAQLNADIDEMDAVQEIFSKFIAKSENTREAVQAERKGDYRQAYNIYSKALAAETAASDDDLDVWQSRALLCLEKLCNWEELGNATRRQFIDGSLHSTEELRYFVRSHIKLFEGWHERVNVGGKAKLLLHPWTQDEPNPVVEFLFKSIHDPQHADKILSNFGPEIVTLLTQLMDRGQTRVYAHKYYTMFTKTWSNLHPLVDSTRLRMLQSLQTVVELEEFADVTYIQNVKEKAEIMAMLLRSWMMRYPLNTDDVSFAWDDIVTNRSLLLTQWTNAMTDDPNTQKAFINALVETSSDILTSVDQAIHAFRKAMSRSALEQRNWSVAETVLRRAAEQNQDTEQIYLTLELNLAKATGRMSGGDIPAGLAQLMDLAVSLSKYLDKLHNLDDRVRWRLLQGRVWQALGNQLLNEHVEVITAHRQFNELFPATQPKLQAINDSIEKKLYTNYGFASDEAAEMVLAKTNADSDLRRKASLALATFCDNILRDLEEEKGNRSADVKITAQRQTYPAVVVEQLLMSLQWGFNQDAVDMLPRLLQMLEIYNIKDLFVQYTERSDVPSWMFIKWIPQLVALVDKPESAAVMPLLHRLAREFPEALRFPFMISSESYTSTDKTVAENIAQLSHQLDSKIHQEFVDQLMLLTNPEHLLGDWIDRMNEAWTHLKDDKERKTFLQKEIQYACRRFLLPATTTGRKQASTSDATSTIHDEFAKKISPALAKIIGAKGEKLTDPQHLKAFKSDESVKAFADEQRKKGTHQQSLKNYSVFLSTYSVASQQRRIELPGQYSSSQRPDVNEHVYIHSFKSNLLILGSLRKPKKLTIYGSDGKEYPFLVKGGEDLRLDQRVEQLFGVMNDVLVAHSLPLMRTYKVVPMTTGLGLIEWLDNTITLRDITEKRCRDPRAPLSLLDTLHKSIVNDKTGNFSGYLVSYEKKSRPEAVAFMDALYNSVPQTLIQSYFMELAASPESYVVLRHRFSRSLAVINSCSYLLGIGDRHSENFLLDLTKGELVLIDFGHSFGSATQNLPVPELIPFRLTQQMINFMGPLGTGGIYKSTMANALGALQESKGRLLNAMDVFLKDPLLDWKKELVKQSSSSGKKDGSVDINKYARSKLDIARQKLSLYNPALITQYELKQNRQQGVVHYMRSIEKVLLGDATVNIRAKRENLNDKRCTDVWAQVECLIDQATDPAILSRCWQGLATWF